MKAKTLLKPSILLLILIVSNPVFAAADRLPVNESARILDIAKRSSEGQYNDIDIKIQNDDGRIIMDASFIVSVMPHQAWEVLTDFNNVPSFISSVRSSKIIHKAGNHLQVSQRTVTKYGLFNFSFESVRKVDLSPLDKIHERMISGNMQAMEETTQLLPEGNNTRIIYHAGITLNTWTLRFAGLVFIENEARKQFQELINEMMRRKQLIL